MENPMKNNIFIKNGFAIALMLTVTLNACKESSLESTMSDEDIEVLTAIVAKSVADQNEGFITDVYDVQRGLSFDGNTSARKESDNNIASGPEWRGGESNHSRSYDPETGVHTFEYKRSFVRPAMSKTMTATLKYIFYAPDESFVEFPARQTVESIDFRGMRTLSITTPNVVNNSQSRGTWTLSGLSTGNIHTFQGTQTNSGSMSVRTRERGFANRTYSIEYQFVDVTIEKALRDSDQLEDKISGTVRFKAEIKQTVNGEETVRSAEGTLDLTGNGTALLRITGLRNVYQINLATGDVSQQR